jgi:hypothetical protein
LGTPRVLCLDGWHEKEPAWGPRGCPGSCTTAPLAEVGGLARTLQLSDKSCRFCPAGDNLDTWKLCSRSADSDPADADELIQSVTLVADSIYHRQQARCLLTIVANSDMLPSGWPSYLWGAMQTASPSDAPWRVTERRSTSRKSGD